MIFEDFETGRFYNEDCFEAMREIPDGVIDMILCDLPYGTTDCKWDTIIPFDRLWAEYWRVVKPNAAIALTAIQPFTTALISSQINYFKYCWIWSKNLPTGFQNAAKQPMRSYEDIPIFYQKQSIYNKQPTLSKITDRKFGTKQKSGNSQKKVKHSVVLVWVTALKE